MASIDLSPSVYIALALNGIFTGLGSALGSYLANNHVIEKVRKIVGRLKNGKQTQAK